LLAMEGIWETCTWHWRESGKPVAGNGGTLGDLLLALEII